MKTKKLLKLIEAVENDTYQQFHYQYLAHNGTGCALGTLAIMLGWIERDEIAIISHRIFDLAPDELGISRLAVGILFNNSGKRIILRTAKGELRAVDSCTKEEWIERAKHFIYIKRK